MRNTSPCLFFRANVFVHSFLSGRKRHSLSGMDINSERQQEEESSRKALIFLRKFHTLVGWPREWPLLLVHTQPMVQQAGEGTCISTGYMHNGRLRTGWAVIPVTDRTYHQCNGKVSKQQNEQKQYMQEVPPEFCPAEDICSPTNPFLASVCSELHSLEVSLLVGVLTHSLALWRHANSCVHVTAPSLVGIKQLSPLLPVRRNMRAAAWPLAMLGPQRAFQTLAMVTPLLLFAFQWQNTNI